MEAKHRRVLRGPPDHGAPVAGILAYRVVSVRVEHNILDLAPYVDPRGRFSVCDRPCFERRRLAGSDELAVRPKSDGLLPVEGQVLVAPQASLAHCGEPERSACCHVDFQGTKIEVRLLLQGLRQELQAAFGRRPGLPLAFGDRGEAPAQCIRFLTLRLLSLLQPEQPYGRDDYNGCARRAQRDRASARTDSPALENETGL